MLGNQSFWSLSLWIIPLSIYPSDTQIQSLHGWKKLKWSPIKVTNTTSISMHLWHAYSNYLWLQNKPHQNHFICSWFCNLNSVQLGGSSFSPVGGHSCENENEKDKQYLIIIMKIVLTLHLEGSQGSPPKGSLEPTLRTTSWPNFGSSFSDWTMACLGRGIPVSSGENLWSPEGARELS